MSGEAEVPTDTTTLRVVVVGQTPPPHGGQAVMIQSLLEGRYEHMHLYHVRMAFSASMEEVGRVRPGKLLELVRVVTSVWRAKARFGGDVLYYPPAGPDRVPLLRDVVVLLAIRPLFARLVLHFHAGGVSELLPRLPAPLRALARRAYGKADTAIVMSDRNPPDGLALGARRQVVVPYGIEDACGRGEEENGGSYARRLEATATPRNEPRIPPTVLFVGVLRESKGVGVLLEACRRLAEKRLEFRCRLVGRFQRRAFEHGCHRFVVEHGLEDRVDFAGVLTGSDKWRAYRQADIFCFPTFFESETFGIVLLEAMQCGLPVVATEWRGIPDVVDAGETGLIVPPRDAGALAEALQSLIESEPLRREMGVSGRMRYEAHFTLERWRATMEEVIVETAS